ncbi:MAG: NAD(P)/FAD-dependent oxidoreductase [Pseudomonadota bacterium]
MAPAVAEHFDVLIVGAGVSGIGMACHLRMKFPARRVAIIERRPALGGTWDLFRYPGARSDSDMFSYGYAFRPWLQPKALASADSIRRYLADTAREYGVDRQIRYGIKIVHAAWSSAAQRWSVSAVDEGSGAALAYTCNFLVGATGYFNYDEGYLPDFPDAARFKGQCIHPQFWPGQLDYTGKRVVVIGSGATAVTVVPAMALAAAHVVMLQRSPSYIFSLPGTERLIGRLETVLPRRWVYALVRKLNIVLQTVTYQAARRWPSWMRKRLLAQTRHALGEGTDMRHFTPAYQPWDERLCVVPDGDLFKAIRSGKASVVTDHIERFSEDGIVLASGTELKADIIVAATGLRLQTLGGMRLSVDGNEVHPSALMSYKAVMLQDVPNMAFVFGYTNAAWTLKADLASEYVCRLFAHMEAKKFGAVVARAPAGQACPGNLMDALGSGYVRRHQHDLPRQGKSAPWQVKHHYRSDRVMLTRDAIEDDVLHFTPVVGISATQ